MLLWRAHNHALPSIDNNPGRAEYRSSLAGVSAHDPKHLWLDRGERCQRAESKDTRVREKVAPRRVQNWDQAAPPAQNSRWFSVGYRLTSRCVLGTPRRASKRRKPPDYLWV